MRALNMRTPLRQWKRRSGFEAAEHRDAAPGGQPVFRPGAAPLLDDGLARLRFETGDKIGQAAGRDRRAKSRHKVLIIL